MQKTNSKSSGYVRRFKKSYGIACCRYNLLTKEPEVLMIKKRYTYAFFNFVFTKYKKNDDMRLRKLFSQMSIQEKADILQLDFDKLWIRIRIKIPNPPETTRIINNKHTNRNNKFFRYNNENDTSYQELTKCPSRSNLHEHNRHFYNSYPTINGKHYIEYALTNSNTHKEWNNNYEIDASAGSMLSLPIDSIKNEYTPNNIHKNKIYYPGDNWRTYYIKKDKFNRNFILSDKGKRLKKLINGTNSIDSIWEIPKGRPSENEKPINTAIREFKEETDLSIDSYRFLTHVKPIINSYIVNKCSYTHTYFIAVAKNFKLDPKINFQSYEQMTEVEDLRWVSYFRAEHLNLKQISPHLRILKLIKKIIKIFKDNYSRAHIEL